MRNAVDDVPRKVEDDGLQELRWLYDRRDVAEARRQLAARLQRWQATYPRLCDRMAAAIEPTLSFDRLPRRHHKHMKRTSTPERLDEEIRPRTRVARILPDDKRCLCLVRALAVATHEGWLEASRSLDIDLLSECRKELARGFDDAA